MNLDSILKIVRGLVKIKGGTDGTLIGNITDALKTSASISNWPYFQTTIDSAHFMTHIGRAFSVEHVFTLNSGQTHEHELVVPAGTRYPHFVYLLETAGDASIQLFSGPTLTRGQEVVAINRNRNSLIVNTTKVYDVSNITNTGNLIINDRTAMGGPSSKGGQTEAQSEYILKGNTNYLFRITSNSNVNIIACKMHWYEYDYLADV